jgi:hypothetical protein
VQHNFVLLRGDGRAVGGRAGVGVGDRLALDPDLIALDRDGLGDLVLDDVLLEPDAAGLLLGLADAQLLLGASHGVAGDRPGGVIADRRRAAEARVAARGGLARAGRARADTCAGAVLGQPGVRPRLAVADPVVRVECGLVVLGELAVGFIRGASLTCELSYGTRSVSPSSAASWSGTKLDLVPNIPVLTSAHSGSPVCASR